MKLSKLTERIDITEVKGDININITDIAIDSRLVKEGSLFVAIKGSANDGHQYIDTAIEAGAKAVICEVMPAFLNENVTYVKTADASISAAITASAFCGYPSEQLKLVGVTGTNGKTTIATLLYKLFMLLGYKSGLLSTVCNYVVDKEVPATHTTPDPITRSEERRVGKEC